VGLGEHLGMAGLAGGDTLEQQAPVEEGMAGLSGQGKKGNV
jgi:hypothetical protein